MKQERAFIVDHFLFLHNDLSLSVSVCRFNLVAGGSFCNRVVFSEAQAWVQLHLCSLLNVW